MSTLKTYWVRYCEWQTFGITLEASNEEEACRIAQETRDECGQEPFEELDGGQDGFAADEICIPEQAQGGAP